ncbi:hypothetical protein RN001_007312 [Aquatica leii]|uniref:SET domain-containing protein n=1 Tax=Aquatica leii TaxID=1421715 RepID=A0AAN7S920_9COLE|nr:hypothetical protein RN001_007312 [Aquatica leii]
MGRRQRTRNRNKKALLRTIRIDHDPVIIKLKHWMGSYNWKSKNNFKLALFNNTGRGITSTRTLQTGETLIEVPYELMITFTTLQNLPVEILKTSLEIHDLLSLYIMFERHKGTLSQWKPYIDSLPSSLPSLPWLCSSNEITMLPNDVKTALLKRRKNFECSWERLKRSINSSWKCDCCQIPADRVITFNLFTWAYVMVNTRAVYINPNIVRELSSTDSLGILSDEPCMALCPFLDMFNHSNVAKNDATLVKVDGKWMYKLITLSGSKKHKEVFISYGSHDNLKLLCEYGFFIPNIELDVIVFDFDDILKVSRLQLNERQYKFIKIRKFDELLYVDKNGVSFNLKAVLFVMLNPFVPDWCLRIFSEYLMDDLLRMDALFKEMLSWKVSEIERVIKQSIDSAVSDYFKTIVSYLKHQLNAIKEFAICTIHS